MSKTGKNPTPRRVVPGTYYCPGCGVDAELRLDKWTRPYLSCHICGLQMFLRTEVARAGFMLLQKIIRKNHRKYRATVMAQAIKETRKNRAPEEGKKLVSGV